MEEVYRYPGKRRIDSKLVQRNDVRRLLCILVMTVCQGFYENCLSCDHLSCERSHVGELLSCFISFAFVPARNSRIEMGLSNPHIFNNPYNSNNHIEAKMRRQKNV